MQRKVRRQRRRGPFRRICVASHRPDHVGMVALNVLLDIGDELVVRLPANCHPAGAIDCLSHDPPFRSRAGVYADQLPTHSDQGRRLRPGEAGLSRRRTDAGADASARARTEGTSAKPHAPDGVRGLCPRTFSAKRRTQIRAKAQLSLGAMRRKPRPRASRGFAWQPPVRPPSSTRPSRPRAARRRSSPRT